VNSYQKKLDIGLIHIPRSKTRSTFHDCNKDFVLTPLRVLSLFNQPNTLPGCFLRVHWWITMSTPAVQSTWQHDRHCYRHVCAYTYIKLRAHTCTCQILWVEAQDATLWCALLNHINTVSIFKTNMLITLWNVCFLQSYKPRKRVATKRLAFPATWHYRQYDASTRMRESSPTSDSRCL